MGEIAIFNWTIPLREFQDFVCAVQQQPHKLRFRQFIQYALCFYYLYQTILNRRLNCFAIEQTDKTEHLSYYRNVRKLKPGPDLTGPLVLQHALRVTQSILFLLKQCYCLYTWFRRSPKYMPTCWQMFFYAPIPWDCDFSATPLSYFGFFWFVDPFPFLSMSLMSV